MAQALHLISNNITPGYGPSESRCLPHSGTSAKSVVVLTLSSCSNNRTNSQVKIGSLKYASGAASFVCRASSGGPRRNSDFSKQNRQNYSRNRNRHSEEKDSNFENLEESDLLTSKNGPLLSLSNTPKFQATAAPGPREREIVELFRKVQAQLRERASVKEEKKVETSKGKGKESETVDSLLKLLRKHSIEQGKKKPSSVTSGDFGLDQPRQNGTESEDKSRAPYNRKAKERNAIAEPNSTSISRPPSNFRRLSPVPKVKFEPIYSNESPVNSSSYLDLTEEKEKQFEVVPDIDVQAELDTEDTELELKQEPEQDSQPYPNGVVFDELLEEESSDTENTDEDDDKESETKHEDLSSLKLPELRAIAKSRGIKGFSKMKKGDLVDLLNS
ncbi:Rho termination factor [Euphorbia peplus]|nr:Rho termination factor [Euphorbia peplus]